MEELRRPHISTRSAERSRRIPDHRIIGSFSLFPLGFNCEYSPYSASEEPVIVFLDQGTIPAIFGIALTWIGGGVIAGGAIVSRRAPTGP
ncbi:hypothetical protein AB0O95_03125 [Rhodoglobus sp. NPDC076762]